MNDRKTTLERAYELARSGQCLKVSDIRAKLKSEHYGDVQQQLMGKSIANHLRRLCVEAQAPPPKVASDSD